MPRALPPSSVAGGASSGDGSREWLATLASGALLLITPFAAALLPCWLLRRTLSRIVALTALAMLLVSLLSPSDPSLGPRQLPPSEAPRSCSSVPTGRAG